jgi:hypothetical protein
MARGRRLKWRGRSAFPERRDPRYRSWVRAFACLLAGRYTTAPLTINDVRSGILWRHVCWGAIDPAHVNDTQGRGAGDVGECVPLCRAAHRALDQRFGPAEFARVTSLDLSSIAAGLGLRYAETERVPEVRS